MKTFCPNSGVATSLAEIVDDRKWRSVCVLIKPGKHSWYIIKHYYWKLNKKPFCLRKKLYWLKNDLYQLYFKDKEILGSPMAWLINCIMDAAQKLICMKLGATNQF